MIKNKCVNFFFYDENDSSPLQTFIIILVLLNYLTVFLFIFWHLTTAIILALWPPFGMMLFKIIRNSDFFKKNAKWLYFLGVILLAIIIETLIYYNGGGLGGEAKSLAHDLIVAVPVYFGIGFGSYLLSLKQKLNPGEYFIIGGLTGVLIESFLGGALDLMWLFLGGMVCIYGVVNATFAPPQQDNERTLKKVCINLILGIILSFVFLIIFVSIGIIIYDLSGLDK